MNEPRTAEEFVKCLSEVKGCVSIQNGMAWLPDGTCIDLAPFTQEPVEEEVDPYRCPYCGSYDDTEFEEEKHYHEYYHCKACGGSYKVSFEEQKTYHLVEPMDPPTKPIVKEQGHEHLPETT